MDGKTLKDTPLDNYSVLQGKKIMIEEINNLYLQGYSFAQAIQLLNSNYKNL